MLGRISIPDISQTGPSVPLPAFFPRTSWPKKAQMVGPQWLYQSWPQLWISHFDLIGLFVWSDLCATILTEPQNSGRTRATFVSLKKGFDKDISPATISSQMKQTVVLWYELSDKGPLTFRLNPMM